MTGQEWQLACDTCLAGDGHHYHPWFAGAALVSLVAAGVVWLWSMRESTPVMALARWAAALLAIGPVVACMIVAASNAGHWVACGDKLADAVRTGQPCSERALGYRITAGTIEGASVVGGVVVTAMAIRRRGTGLPLARMEL